MINWLTSHSVSPLFVVEIRSLYGPDPQKRWLLRQKISAVHPIHRAEVNLESGEKTHRGAGGGRAAPDSFEYL